MAQSMNVRILAKLQQYTSNLFSSCFLILQQKSQSMNAITGSILIDFQNMPGSEEQKDYHKQVYGVIKLHLSQMEKYEKTSHFNICEKCGMVLTKQDRGSVYDWEEISSNPKQFKQILEKHKEDSDNIVVWICSFCDEKNVIECSNLKFAKNNSRVVVRQAQNNQKKDPIMLIVFDISGSMEELLTNQQQNVYSGFVQKLKTTKIYKKIVAEQEQEIKEIMEKQNIKIEPNDPKNKYKDYLKKNKLLMGLTEWLVNEINPNSNATEKMQRQGGFGANKQKKNKVTKTIGFMFFNSNVIIEPTNGDKQKRAIVVCDHKESFGAKTQHMHRERVNFDDFENLYKLGVTYGAEYTTKMSDFKFDNLDIKFGDSGHGQTALGPALVMALGVISQHGAGSSIVVVTDGIGNKGIFDQSETWQEQLKILKYRLQKHKCFLTVLECRNINENNRDKDINNVKTCIDEFCVRNDETIAKKINILVDKNKTAENLIEDIKKKMSCSINREHVLWTNEVKINCQNANIKYQEDSAKLSQKLINQQQAVYIHPKFDHNKLKAKDYLHHFMTQAVIKYENTQTGEQSIFMTYIQQKFIKFDQIKKRTIKQLDNEKTFHDMIEYLSVEQENYDIGNIPLSFVKKTFRDTLMFSKSIYNRSLRFPMKNGAQTKQEDVQQFTQIWRKNDERINEEQQDDSSML